MPTQIFFAPAASGKTAYVLALARSAALSRQQEVRICVPTSLQAQAWRRRLVAAGGALGVHVHIFDQLVVACLNAAREAYSELSEPVQYRLLRAVIDRLPLDHYAPLTTKPGFIQINQDLIADLKAALVTPDAFGAAVTALGDAPRLRELGHIYTAYQTQLRAHGWADRVGLHWLAVEALRDRAPEACRDWPLLIVDGFDDFTPSQLALLALLAGRVGSCVVTLPQAAGGRYPRYRRTMAAVAAALGVTPQPLPTASASDATHPTLRHLARHLFAPPAGPEDDGAGDGAAAANDGAITLLEVADRAAEARAALRWLKQRIVRDGVPVDQVALLARDITPYRPFIQQTAAEFGVPIRLVDGRPLQQSPIITALLALLRLHLPLAGTGEPTLPRRAVVDAWRSPYFRWGSEDLALAPADADLLDAFARQQRVIRGETQWREAFAVAGGMADADEAEPAADEAEPGEQLTAAQARRLRHQFDHFLALSRPPADAATMRHFVRWLETLIGPDPRADDRPPPAGSLQVVAQARAGGATAAADVAALRTLKDTLRGLVWAETALGPARPVDFAHFFSELEGAAAAARTWLPAQQDRPEMLAAGVIDVRGLSFAAVAVMGLGEGAFPATISEDPFLRDADRVALRAQFDIPLPPSTQSAEREFFYEAVTRARDALLLTRSVLADNGAEWVASPFWEETRARVQLIPQPARQTAVLPLAETASAVEWWESVAADAAFAADAAVAALAADDAVRRHIETGAAVLRARLAGGTAAAAPTVWDGDLAPLAATLRRRYGPDHVWSASRLEAYRTCGYLFFLQNVLAIQPRAEPAEGLDARQLGSVVHAIFEAVTRRGLPDPPAETAVRARVAAVAGPILDAAPAQLGFRQTPWWTQTRAELIDSVARSLIALADGEYTFFRAEAEFGIHAPPLVIDLGDDAIRLRGFIDRIDRRADGRIRIVDYKSSGKSAYTSAAFRSGKKLQLPLYALAAQEALGLGEVADGFYWHFQQAEPSSFQLHKAEEGIDAVIETAVRHAWDAVAGIRAGRFAPQPPAAGCPSYCPAAAFCWHYTPGYTGSAGR